jgi:hypothetical protein
VVKVKKKGMLMCFLLQEDSMWAKVFKVVCRSVKDLKVRLFAGDFSQHFWQS